MDIGTRKSERASSSGFSSDDVVRVQDLSEGKYPVRIVAGPVQVDTIFYPTLVASAGGKLIPIKKMVTRDTSIGGILDEVAELDKSVQVTYGVDRPRSIFSPSSKWVYLAFDIKKDPDKPIRLETNWSIYLKLSQLEEEIYFEEDPDTGERVNEDSSKLMNGLIFMYNVIIEKIRNPKNPHPQFGWIYDVHVAKGNPFRGKVSISMLEDDAEIPEDLLMSVFSDSQWQALKVLEQTFGSLRNFIMRGYKTMTPQEVLKKLQDFPPNLSAIEDGKPLFLEIGRASCRERV